jgi:hypothetical protein
MREWIWFDGVVLSLATSTTSGSLVASIVGGSA